MVADFDLNLFPLYRISGQEWSGLPGLVALKPPRKVARGREGDALVIYLTLSGNASLSSADYAKLTTHIGQRFYQCSGSLTSALRAAAETLNQSLLERNLGTTAKGQYTIGRLILGVLRAPQFVFVQSGPTHIFHINGGGVRQIHDQQISGRGLGFSQTIQLYYSQVELNAGDNLLLCATLPAGWEVILLSESVSTTLEALRRKLMAFSKDDLNAILVQVRSGKGGISILRGGMEGIETPKEQPAESKPVAPVPILPGQGVPLSPQSATAQPPVLPPAMMAQTGNRPLTAGKPDIPVAAAEGQSPAVPPKSESSRLPPRTTTDIPEIARPKSQRGRAVYRGAARAIGTGRRMSEKIGQGFKAFLPRLVPATEEKESTISNSTLAFIAVAVALVVVVVSVTVYSKYGIETQYQENIQLAMEAFNSANAAANAGDVAEARRSWELTIEYVKRAERYRRASDSQTLRLQAQSMLDTLDSVVRLDFRSALLVGLDKSVEVALMAATETDLYLLNATRGNVMRAFITNQGYEVDPSFKCEPGLYGDYQVGELIDMVALPRVNAFDAAVLVMDGNGTLLYCAPEVEPHPVLLAAPELGWRGLAGFTLDTDSKNLYVLDPSASRVWVYSGDLVNFLDPPFSFFGEQVPKNMGTVIDLAANGEDLYLLFQDGHVTRCTMREVAPTSCSDQVMIDTRLQHQSGATISDAIFTRIFFASPPDPSLYMFEPNSQAIYRFSPRPDGLFLQGQFRAAAEMVKKQFTTAASAVAISPNHYFFLCIGNQVYYATDVP